MESKQHGNSPETRETPAALDTFFEHYTAAMQSLANLRWEAVGFHLAEMEVTTKSVPTSVKPIVEGLYEAARGLALGNEQLAKAKSPQDQETALKYLSAARTALRKLKTEQRELFKNSGFIQFSVALEGQILVVQGQAARARGDVKEVARLEGQQEQVLDDMIQVLELDHPLRHYFEGVKRFREGMPKLLRGMRAAKEMNLDLAQQDLRDSSVSFDAMNDHFSKAKIDSLILKAPRQAAEGFSLLASAQDAYVATLRAAIIGDVSKTDVKALEQAERKFLDGAEMVTKAVQVAPGFFGGLDLRPVGQAMSQLARNLRTLCERSLSPKEISVATAPKAVFYFLGTFVVLLFALPISGLVEKIGASELGFLLVVSLIVSLVGAFGFEATRFLPFFEVLTRFIPGARVGLRSGTR